MAASIVTVDGLTLKQERFCQAFLSNGGNATEAYRSAYNVSPDSYPNGASRDASLMLDKPKIGQRISRLIDDAVKAEGVTPEYLIARLRSEIDADDGTRGKGARVRACELAMRWHGMIQERSSDTTVTVNIAAVAQLRREYNTEELRAMLQQMEPPVALPPSP